MEKKFHPIAVLERINKPLIRFFALLLIAASLWGIVNQFTLWNRPIKLVIGTAGNVVEEEQADRVRYRLSFTIQETGQEMQFWLLNNSPTLDYFLTQPPTDTVALRYWPDDMMVASINPLIVGADSIENPIPPPGLVLATSILGLLVALAILIPDLLGRFFFRSGGRRSKL